MPIVFTTDIGKVRLLLNDVDESNLVFGNDEIQAFLDLEGGSVKLAAALAIDTNALNEALASKVIKDHQMSTDGAKLADAMHALAQSLRDSDDGFFEVVDSTTSWPEGTEPPLTGWW